VFMYEMIVGQTPFIAANKHAVYKKILRGTFACVCLCALTFDVHVCLDRVEFPAGFPSAHAHHLIDALLKKDPCVCCDSGMRVYVTIRTARGDWVSAAMHQRSRNIDCSCLFVCCARA
jgi:hypothetical protein